jgi:hypothetical protein
LVVAYVLGHVISAVSAPILEDRFVERTLGKREDVLFGEGEQRFGVLFKGYFEPLPTKIRELVIARAREEVQITTDRKALFLYCDAQVRQTPAASPMLATFLNVYGFARNTCLALVIAAVLLGFGAFTHHMNWQTKAWLAGAALAASVGLFYRYLKFFRLYAREVFLFYATAPTLSGASTR